MNDTSARTFKEDFRRFFVKGLAVLLPTVLTLWIVVACYRFINQNIAEPINRSVRLLMGYSAAHWEPMREFEPFKPTREDIETARLDRSDTSRDGRIEARLRREKIGVWWQAHWYLDLIGLVIAIVAVYIAGRLLGGYFGRRLYGRIEQFITSMPVFKQVYPHVKQIVEFIFSDDKPIKFNRVIVVQYPRRGIWSVGLVTGDTMRAIAEHSGQSVTVFIPSSPTPFTGYTITVPREDVIEVPISVDEALRFTVSGGVLIPEHQKIRDSLQDAVNSRQLTGRAGTHNDNGDADGTVRVQTQPSASDKDS